jgi:hypothetical protein
MQTCVCVSAVVCKGDRRNERRGRKREGQQQDIPRRVRNVGWWVLYTPHTHTRTAHHVDPAPPTFHTDAPARGHEFAAARAIRDRKRLKPPRTPNRP